MYILMFGNNMISEFCISRTKSSPTIRDIITVSILSTYFLISNGLHLLINSFFRLLYQLPIVLVINLGYLYYTIKKALKSHATESLIGSYQ